MKRTITLASLIALMAAPAAVFAGGTYWTNSTKTINGEVVDSKEKAYEVGLEMIQRYQGMSSKELREEFTNISNFNYQKSFSLINTKVTVDEFLKGNGEIVYQPVLDVKYKYRKRELGSR